MDAYNLTTRWLLNQIRLVRPLNRTTKLHSASQQFRVALYTTLSQVRRLMTAPDAPANVFIDRMWILVSYMLTMPMTENMVLRFNRLIAHRDHVLTLNPISVALSFIRELQLLLHDPCVPINHYILIYSAIRDTFMDRLPIDPMQTPLPGRLYIIDQMFTVLHCQPLGFEILSTSEEYTCKLCCAEVPLGRTVITLNPLCQHWFHIECLRLWLLSGDVNAERNCPVCARTLIEAEPAYAAQ